MGGSTNIGSTSTKSFSSSSSSFSSSSSSSKMSSNFMGRGMSSLPPMRGMEMPGLSFEEMSSMPLSSNSMTMPEYTATSPPMSPPPGEMMSHSVKTTDDYKEADTSEANDSVLLKFKEGSDYKLALNMQQFSPDDITIKLNGQEISIEAEGAGEKFAQKHFIPYNIGLDAMPSSLSSDGVPVIRAPKKQ